MLLLELVGPLDRIRTSHHITTTITITISLLYLVFDSR